MPCLWLPSSSKGQHCCGPDIAGLASKQWGSEIQEAAEGREFLSAFTGAYRHTGCTAGYPHPKLSLEPSVHMTYLTSLAMMAWQNSCPWVQTISSCPIIHGASPVTQGVVTAIPEIYTSQSPQVENTFSSFFLTHLSWFVRLFPGRGEERGRRYLVPTVRTRHWKK